MKLNGKPVAESQVEMTELVLPTHTNSHDTVFGGTVMSWIDIAAATTAMRHSRRSVVTASVDALHFLAPIKKGFIVHIKASVNFTSRTSMEVGVRVDAENPLTGELNHTVTAYTTFVALDEFNKPTPVEPILPQTKDEHRRYDHAKMRRAARVELAEALKAKNATANTSQK